MLETFTRTVEAARRLTNEVALTGVLDAAELTRVLRDVRREDLELAPEGANPEPCRPTLSARQ